MGKKKKLIEVPPHLFCDASYLIAYFAGGDQHHSRAISIGNYLSNETVKLMTSWPTLSEAITLLLYHYGYFHSNALLKSLEAFQIIIPLEGEYSDAVALFKKLNKDKQLSFNDVLTCVIVSGRLKGIPILTFDNDFSKIGLRVFSP